MSTLLDRLKERKLVQWALAYLAGAWGTIEVLDVLADPFGLTSSFRRAVVVLLVFGFGAALVLAWFHAEKGRQRATALELVLLAALLFGGVSTSAVSYRRGDSAAGVAQNAEVAGALQGPVVAVLPFDNASADAEEASFIVEAIHSEILTNLSKMKGLNAISRTSVLGYERANRTVRQIAEDLGASTILEGQIQKIGDALRINVTLIDGLTDSPIWSEIYDRVMDPTSVFAVQGEIASAIADALAVNLAPGEQSRLSRVPTSDREAADLYMRGREAEDRALRGEADFFGDARDYYQQALERDPDYADAQAAFGRMIWSVYWKMDSPRAPASADSMRVAAERAIELDPDLAAGYLLLGEYCRWHTTDYAAALENILKAKRLDPDDVPALTALAHLNMKAGDFATARANLERAAQLDPLEGQSQRAAGMVAFYQRRYDDADAHLSRAALRYARDMNSTKPAPEDFVPIRVVYTYRMGIYLAADGDTHRAYEALKDVIERTEMESIHISVLLAGLGVTGPVELGPAMLGIDSVRALLAEGQIIPPARAILLRLAGGDTQVQQELWAGAANNFSDDQYGATGRRRYNNAFEELQGRSIAALALARAGRHDVALAQLARARQISDDYMLAEVTLHAEPRWAMTLVELGEYGQALDLLEDMMARPSAMSVGLLKVQPEWDPLRGSPRFRALLGRG